MLLTDFNYDLPKELIATYPLAKRCDSRLLCLNSLTGQIKHRAFPQLIDLIRPNDLLVCNDTQVIAARLLGEKVTGGHVEILIERILDAKRVLAHMRVSKKPLVGSRIYFAQDVCFEVLGRKDNLFELSCMDPRNVLDVIESIGEIPLPPYLHRAPEASDYERYQTVYAQHKGSVAAPTAGLHFDQETLAAFKAKKINIAYITLHIGAGTFAPVRDNDITKHQMHAEKMSISAEVCEQIAQTKAAGGRVIAVGTTTARTLETASLSGEIEPFVGETDIFIYPGFHFRCVDALLTNLHLPNSTLLMLVAALGGYEHIMAAYRAAVAEKYRFFSYGDAMFIAPNC
jgi:S-adenosylmethionine:tRNA ribosyltransferase-isomerase